MKRIMSTGLLLLILAAPAMAEDDGFIVERETGGVKQSQTRKPVKIKLKRAEDGRYTWELTGENPDDVIATDRKLREQLLGAGKTKGR